MQRQRRHWIYILSVVSVVLSLTGLVLASGFVRNRVVQYVLVAFVAATAVYLLIGRGLSAKSREPSFPLPPKFDNKVVKAIDAVVFLLLVVAVATARFQSIGLPDFYYLILVAATAVILARILVAPSLMTLVETALFAIVIRANTWYSAPIIGSDSRAHVAYTSYMIRTGEPIPFEVSYYHDFPGAHLLASSVTFATGLPPEQSFFIALGIAAVAGIVLVSLFVRDAFPFNTTEASRLAGAIVALCLTVSLWHQFLSALPIAQTLGLLYIPLLLYACFYRLPRTRMLAIGFLSIFGATITHNTTPVVMVIAFVGYYGAELISNPGGWTRRVRGTQSLFIALGVVPVYLWMETNYLSYHVGRFLGILSFSDPLTSRSVEQKQRIVSQAIEQNQQISTVGAVFSDPKLYMGFELLVAGFVFLVLGYIFGERLVCSASLRTAPVSQVLSAGAIVLAISGAFVVGSGDVGRTFPAMMLFVAPILGYISSTLTLRRTLGVTVAIALILSFPIITYMGVVNGIAHPGASPTENELKPARFLTQSELAAMDHTHEYRIEAGADTYLYNSISPLRRKGTSQSTSIQRLPRIDDLSSSIFKERPEPIIYRSRYETYAGIMPPRHRSVMYDSGRATVIL